MLACPLKLSIFILVLLSLKTDGISFIRLLRQIVSIQLPCKLEVTKPNLSKIEYLDCQLLALASLKLTNVDF